MSRLMTGVLLVLTFVCINVLVALAQDLDATTPTVTSCTGSEETYDDCEQVGKTSFLGAILRTTVSGIPGLPGVFNAIYVLIGGILLVTGVLLIVVAFVPTLAA